MCAGSIVRFLMQGLGFAATVMYLVIFPNILTGFAITRYCLDPQRSGGESGPLERSHAHYGGSKIPSQVG